MVSELIAARQAACPCLHTTPCHPRCAPLPQSLPKVRSRAAACAGCESVKRFELVSLPLDKANAFVVRFHRHHPPVRGYKFAIGLSREGIVVGVAIVGRPVARGLDNGLTLEITRVAIDGTKDACSALYGACRRAAFALGYSYRVSEYRYTPTCEVWR